MNQISQRIGAVGAMLMLHAAAVDDLPEREAFDEMFRAALLATHVLNIIGPVLITVGHQMGLTDEDFDGLALDLATEGAAADLTPDDFA